MPPGKKLPAETIADFERWVSRGAVDPRVAAKSNLPEKKEIDWAEARKFWSFQPIAHPTAPPVKDHAWPRSDLDRFVLAKLEARELRPVADADRLTLLRRLTFDLTGLPPTLAEMDAFVADKDSNAVEKVVDRLLASPQFGEHWGRHWLDVARYAESNGNVDNYLFPHAWRYRDYVIAAMNSDKPLDRFIAEQVAGDLLPAASVAERNELLTATGFLALTSKPRPQNNPDYALDLVAEQIEVTTTAFMGLTVACARCHDHKFDRFRSASTTRWRRSSKARGCCTETAATRTMAAARTSPRPHCTRSGPTIRPRSRKQRDMLKNSHSYSEIKGRATST